MNDPSAGQPSLDGSIGVGASLFSEGDWDALGPNVQSLFHQNGADGDGGAN